MDKVKAIINANLAEVWGADGDGGKPSDDWPYRLEYWGTAKGWALYRFTEDNVARYAGYDPQVGVISGPIADMTLQDLADEFRGGDWIYQRCPIDLDDPEAKENDSIPSPEERRAAIESLALNALDGNGDYTILRGYYLEATGELVALIRPHGSRGEAVMVGTGMSPVRIGYRKATPDRRICIALARNMPD